LSLFLNHVTTHSN